MKVTITYVNTDGSKRGVLIGDYSIFGIDFDEGVIMFDRHNEFNKILLRDVKIIKIEDKDAYHS
jgi:hypothetical protein